MAFLFVHFTNDGKEDKESIWFSLSYDGLNWTDLGTNEPLLKTNKGTTGIRDPFIVYDKNLKKYFIIATDLCTTKGGNWGDFSSRGSKSLFVWETSDLINFSEEKLIKVGIDDAGCVWAPEAVFCKEENKWFVFFASNVKEENDKEPKQRIYGCFTKDFNEFSPTFKYIDAETAVIDTTVVYFDGYYYRFSKDETNKVITLERSKKLLGDKFEKIHSPLLSSFEGLEGPEAYFLPKLNKWCLIADQYRTGKGYLPILCSDISKGEFSFLEEGAYNMGKRKKRHGGVIEISDEKARELEKYYGVAK